MANGPFDDDLSYLAMKSADGPQLLVVFLFYLLSRGEGQRLSETTQPTDCLTELSDLRISAKAHPLDCLPTSSPSCKAVASWEHAPAGW